MKHLSMVLIVCMIFGSIYVYAEDLSNAPYTITANSQFAYTLINDPNQTDQKYNNNWVIQSGTNDIATPKRALYYKFDISDIINQNIEVKSVNLLSEAVSVTYSTNISFFDCPTNDLVNGDNYATVPANNTKAFVTSNITNLTYISPDALPGVDANAFNFNVDFTNYVKSKLAEGNNSFTFMMYTTYSGSTYTFKKHPVLYIELDGVNISPTICINMPDTNDEIYEGRPFEFSATATDDRGIEKVEFYADDVLVGGVNKVGDVYSVTVNGLTLGSHKLKVVATDIFGKKAFEERTVDVKILVLTHDVLNISQFANTLQGDENQTNQKYNGKWVIASQSGGIASPYRALYYKFDLSSYVAQGYDFEQIWFMQEASGVTYNSKVEFFDCEDNTLETGQNYLTVPQHNTTAFQTSSITNLSLVNTELYPDAPANCNFLVNFTDYAKQKLGAGKTSFSFMMYTSYNTSTYYFVNHPVLYIKLGNKNMVPTIELKSPAADEFLTSDTIEFSVEANDIDGSIAGVDFYINNTLVTSGISQSGNRYSLSISNYQAGNYMLKAVATDNGGKTAQVTKSFTVVYQHVALNTTRILPSDVSQIEYAKDTTGPDKNGNYWIQGDGAGSYAKAMVMKYHIGECEKYQIKKVELVAKGALQNNNAKMYLYDLLSNEWNSPVDYSGIPGYSTTTVATASAHNLPVLDTDYSLADCRIAIDITDYVLSKTENNQSQFGILLTLSSSSNFCIGNVAPFLFVTYSDNDRPSIEILSPSAENAIAPNAGCNISANITDEDSDITQVTISFDGVLYDYSKNNSVYTVIIPAEKVTRGEHTIVITASDWLGAKRIASKKVIATDYYINNKGFSDGNGGTAVIEAGNTVSADINITNTLSDTLDVTVVIALYDAKNTMHEFAFKKYIILKDETKDISAQLTIPNNIDVKSCNVKAYVIDHLMNMTILDDLLEFK